MLRAIGLFFALITAIFIYQAPTGAIEAALANIGLTPISFIGLVLFAGLACLAIGSLTPKRGRLR